MKTSMMTHCAGAILAIVMGCLLLAPGSASADPVLDIAIGGQTRQFRRDELLRRPDVTRIAIANDVSYHKAMNYLAVPLAALLAGLNPPANSFIESVALDGFVAQLPLDLVSNTDQAKPIAWLAIEPADTPWPKLPGKDYGAGPFYLVWMGATADTIRSEQWPYQLKRLESQPSPVERWPALQVDPALPATDPVRAGLALFATQCLPCHTLNGAGASDVGPDLNQPMSPTRYMTRDGLHALIRDPKSVRSWPTMKMPGFGGDRMSDREIDLVIGYLAHMATRRKESP